MSSGGEVRRRLRRWRDWPLRVKLTLAVTTMVVGLVLAVTLLAIERERRNFQLALQQQADLALSSLTATTANALYQLDIDYLSNIAERLRRVDNVAFTRFFDARGWRLADASEAAPALRRDPFGERLVASEGTLFERLPGRLLAGRPVRVGDQTFGAVAIALSTTPLQHRIAAARNQGLAVALLAVLVGVSLVLVLSRSSMQRLEELVAATGRLAEGELGPPLTVAGRDEIGTLAAAFNDMRGRLRSTLDELRESEARYALATRGANDGLWDWQLDINRLYLSPRWKGMLGFADHEMESTPQAWIQQIHPEDRTHFEKLLADHLQGRSAHFESEHRVRHRDGGYRWVLCRGLAVQDETGRPRRMAGSQTDITERKNAEQQLLHDAFHDALTALPNRALLMDRLERAIGHARRGDIHFALLFLDIDRFKTVNDSLGHSVGDQLLVAFAERLRGCLRNVDTLARLGGDEFVVLLELIEDAETAQLVADRILSALRRPFPVADRQLFARASIGIVTSSVGFERAEQVLSDADIALYRAKALGKGRSVVFDVHMRERAADALQLEVDLRAALDHDELCVHYQPIVALATGAVVGFEALARWRHPGRGLLAPADFLAVAEEAGLGAAIDAWMLRESCRQLSEWHGEGLLGTQFTVSVNLASQRFSRLELVAEVASVLAESGLAAERLVLEITEGAIIDNTEVAAEVFRRLRAIGVEVHIDDFGTGYSSLSYLHRFTIGAIKIDRSFIARLPEDDGSVELVGSIVRLAADLGLGVIAEGVERRVQRERLQALGCELGQGLLFAGPLERTAARGLLDEARDERRRQGMATTTGLT